MLIIYDLKNHLERSDENRGVKKGTYKYCFQDFQ